MCKLYSLFKLTIRLFVTGPFLLVIHPCYAIDNETAKAIPYTISFGITGGYCIYNPNQAVEQEMSLLGYSEHGGWTNIALPIIYKPGIFNYRLGFGLEYGTQQLSEQIEVSGGSSTIGNVTITDPNTYTPYWSYDYLAALFAVENLLSCNVRYPTLNILLSFGKLWHPNNAYIDYSSYGLGGEFIISGTIYFRLPLPPNIFATWCKIFSLDPGIKVSHSFGAGGFSIISPLLTLSFGL